VTNHARRAATPLLVSEAMRPTVVAFALALLAAAAMCDPDLPVETRKTVVAVTGR
jgi:hypothetical protein